VIWSVHPEVYVAVSIVMDMSASKYKAMSWPQAERHYTHVLAAGAMRAAQRSRTSNGAVPNPSIASTRLVMRTVCMRLEDE
jgi:hypothetical protein